MLTHKRDKIDEVWITMDDNGDDAINNDNA
jgi:hypothetical protein